MSSPIRSALAAALILTAAPALAEGDPAKGEKVFKKCMACHAVEADAPKKVGPNLHLIVNRPTAIVEGFAYSDAMKALGAEGHVWTPEELDKFLESPKTLVPGTKMTFAGLKKPEERADVIAYLTSLGVTEGGAAPEAATEGGEAAPSN